jgi:hypothetical protein
MNDFDPITVKKLREILKQFPDDMIVVTDGYETGYEKILLPEIITVRREADNMYYDGEYQVAEEDDRETIEVLIISRNRRND